MLALKEHFDIYLYFSLNDRILISVVSPGFTIRTVRTQKKFTEVSLLSSTIQLLQSDLLIKYILDYKSWPPKFRAESK